MHRVTANMQAALDIGSDGPVVDKSRMTAPIQLAPHSLHSSKGH